VDGVDDLGVIDAAQIHRGHAEIGVPELPLDDHDRDPLARHLDRMRMPKLMPREPTANPGRAASFRGLSVVRAGRPGRVPPKTGS
jgi:hypothetical protein